VHDTFKDGGYGVLVSKLHNNNNDGKYWYSD